MTLNCNHSHSVHWRERETCVAVISGRGLGVAAEACRIVVDVKKKKRGIEVVLSSCYFHAIGSSVSRSMMHLALLVYLTLSGSAKL